MQGGVPLGHQGQGQVVGTDITLVAIDDDVPGAPSCDIPGNRGVAARDTGAGVTRAVSVEDKNVQVIQRPEEKFNNKITYF